MCNRPRLPIDYVIDYLFFEDNRNRHFKKKKIVIVIGKKKFRVDLRIYDVINTRFIFKFSLYN